MQDVPTGSLPLGDMQWQRNKDRKKLLGRTKDYTKISMPLACMHPPTQAEWNIWRQQLTSGLSLGRSQKLPLALGQWRAHMRVIPGYFIDPQGDHLLSLQTSIGRCTP